MLNTQVHTVTLKLLRANGMPVLDYLKTHIQDVNAWQSYFELSPLDHDSLLQETLAILPKPLVVEIACRFAETVLAAFETEFPKDNSPRNAILAARAWIKNPSEETANAANAAYAANAAANAAYAANAANAANAAYAAHWAANTAYAAADAAAANATYWAANAANAAAYAANPIDKVLFQKSQLKIVLDVVRENQDNLGKVYEI